MSRRGFTLLELLVAVALSTILIGVLALTFQAVTRARDTSVARLDAARTVGAALDRLERDWRLAVAVPDPAAPGLEVSLSAAPVQVDGPAGPVVLRHDALSLLVLEQVDLDGDGAPDQARVSRVRWEVAWDAGREEGTLLRIASPVAVPGAPGLPTLPAEVREEVLRSVVEVRLRPWLDASPEAEAFRDPPPAGDLAALRARLVHQGVDGTVASFDLCTPAPLLRIEPDALVRLEDTRAPPRFDRGLYTVRQRRTFDDGRDPPHRLVLTTPPGDARGGVRYTAAWLPAALQAVVDARSPGPRGPVVRRTVRVLLRDAPGPALVPPGAPE
ncbi:MAG: prepilin-type N-terminal cleavage/methylation domain-containing protein [Planctomycetes bacterium]|nr:prepilin-type N-terminal cleavage/methylation domain-containing protein [Planctomycetota bacterium]